MEIKKARNWYWWLWLSPAVTVPTVIGLNFSDVEYVVRDIVCPGVKCSYILRYTIPIVTLLFISALWHLILLIPALNKENKFVRWHGRQALMLAGLRTIVPIGLVLWVGNDGLLPAIPILIVIWIFGTLWGQLQAARGDCSLMRWFGLEIPQPLTEPVAEADPLTTEDPNELVEVIRFSTDVNERRNALSELKRFGLVENLYSDPAHKNTKEKHV
ncbi:MAG: hypothetical protein MUO62_14015 [Anaerolineales bacterium]|nr:hypothetical protein [Anaerolineales bacterium]